MTALPHRPVLAPAATLPRFLLVGVLFTTVFAACAPPDRPAEPFDVVEATIPAMQSGLFWGTVGAIRQLVDLLGKEVADEPEVFLSGGAIRTRPAYEAVVVTPPE